MKIILGRNHLPARLRSQKGQAALFMGSMILTFLLFFMFVINIGMLVNAKINLQNAADLAAYAGASVQARQMNNISFLNYEMRRQYKKFLFRYYVLGNMAYDSHPRTPSSGARSWSNVLPGKPGFIDYQVPTVCMVLSAGDNYCRVGEIPGISIPDSGVADAINSVLQDQVKQIEKIRQASCVNLGKFNNQILFSWLFNTDPTLKELDTVLKGGSVEDEKIRSAIKVMVTLGGGLGLVPRNFLTLARIKMLASYLNNGAQTIDFNSLSKLNSNDPASNERALMAFLSAYNTLGDHSFNSDSIQLQELIPPGGFDKATGKGPLFSYDPIMINFDAYTVNLVFKTTGTAADCQNPAAQDPNQVVAKAANCFPCVTPIQVPGVITGIAKKLDQHVYYAVKLEAEANLMFALKPYNLKLRAYSAAQPFGSRIGPQVDQVQPFLLRHAKNDQFCSLGTPCIGAVPNIAAAADVGPDGNVGGREGSETGMGFERLDLQYGLFKNLVAQNNLDVAESASIDEISLQRAYIAAMSPNPWEIGYYNIPASDIKDTGGDFAQGGPPEDELGEVTGGGGKLFNFQDKYIQHFNKNGVMAMWAPLDDPSAGSSSAQVVADIVDYIKNLEKEQATKTGSNTRTLFTDDFTSALKKGLSKYVDDLKAGKGEAAAIGGSSNLMQEAVEGFNIAKILDPLNHRPMRGDKREPVSIPNSPGGKPIALNPSNALQLKSSWSELKRSEFQKYGRTGYSVKIVPFRAVLQKPNPPPDPNGELSLLPY